MDDRLPETCERCGGWVYHRRTPCDCRPAVRWVRQEDPHGCGLAALAMLLGRSYADVKADFIACLRLEEEVTAGLFEIHGHSFFEWDTYLTERGYAVARKFLWMRKHKRVPWPCEPFGDVHLCEVQHSLAHAGHMVVMLADGAVLDPATEERKRLTDYWRVNSVAAVVPRTRRDENEPLTEAPPCSATATNST